jgi:membrane protein
VLSQAVSSASGRSSAGSLVALIIGVVVAPRGASGGMAARETGAGCGQRRACRRKFLAKRLLAFPLMLATVVLGRIASALIVFSTSLGSAIEGHVSGRRNSFHHHLNRGALDRHDHRHLTALLGLLLWAERASPRWQWVSLGGLVGTAIFLLASLGFFCYVAKFGSYGKTYGAFVGVVILIFWLYLVGIAVLLGVEINAEAECEAAAQAGRPQAQATAQQLNQHITRYGRAV